MGLEKCTQSRQDISEIVRKTLDCFAARYYMKHSNGSSTHYLESPGTHLNADYSCRIEVYSLSAETLGIRASRYAHPKPKMLPERIVGMDTLFSGLQETYQMLYPL